MRHRAPRLGLTWISLLVLLGSALLFGCDGTSPVGPPAVTRGVVYVGIGASDAVGIGAFPLTEGYVYELAGWMRDLRDPVTLHNLGINGARVDELRTRGDAAVAAQPDIVTLWTGSNDVIGGVTPESFRRDLDALLQQLSSMTSARIFVGDLADLTRAPLFGTFPDPDVTTARVAAFNREIEGSVAAHGAVLVRLSALTLDAAMFAIDGFHPSNEGHERIASAFWSSIRPYL